jgi:hypothetical protein
MLRVQGFESSVNKVFQKEKLVNSKTIIYSPQLKGLVMQELTLVRQHCQQISDEIGSDCCRQAHLLITIRHRLRPLKGFIVHAPEVGIKVNAA